MAKLGEYCEVNPSKVTLSDDKLISFVPMTAVSEEGAIDVSATKAYADVKTGFTCFQNGDVLFAKITPCMENGKGAIAENLHNGIGFGSTEFHVLRPDPTRLDSKYLYYCTVWPTFRKDCERNMTGSAGQKRVPKKYIETYDVSIPDLPTQRRLAATLDKVSEGIAVCRQMLADLDVMVKARFVEMFGDPEHNTKQWPVMKLSELCKVGSSKRVYQNEMSSTGVPFLRISDLGILMDTGELHSELFITDDKYSELMQNNQIPVTDDILVTSRGTLGRCYIVKPDDKFYFQDGMISWLSDLSEQITSLYIADLFSMHGIKKQIEELQAGSTVAYLSIAMLKKLNIMVPPVKLQRHYEDFVTQADKSKSVVQQQLTELETLKKSLMQEYFG